MEYTGNTVTEEDFERAKKLGVFGEIVTLDDYKRALQLGRADLQTYFETAQPGPSLDRKGWERIHSILFGHVHPWAGEIRKEGQDVMVGGKRKALDPIYLDDSLHALHIRQMDRIDQGTVSERISTIAETHCRFERDHPFLDGTGRTGRAALDLQMNAAFGEHAWVEMDQSCYKEALHSGDRGDYRKMGELLGNVLEQTLRTEMNIPQEEVVALEEFSENLGTKEKIHSEDFKKKIIEKTERERLQRENRRFEIQKALQKLRKEQEAARLKKKKNLKI